MTFDAGQRLRRIAKLVEPKQTLAVVADEPDNRMLECAAEAGSEYIITEDRALLRLRKYGDVKLIRAITYLAYQAVVRCKDIKEHAVHGSLY